MSHLDYAGNDIDFDKKYDIHDKSDKFQTIYEIIDSIL